MRQWVSFSAALMLASGVTGAAALVASCGSGRSAGEASLAVDGEVQLTSASRQTVTREGGATVHRGDTVKVVRGSAVLSFGDSRRIELRRGTSVKMDTVPVLTAGDALMLADGSPFRVSAAGTTLSVTDGVTRLSRGLGIEASAYRGAVEVSSAGRRMTLASLRRATVASLGVLPLEVEPVRLRATDAWDRRYLGDAMELSDELQARSDGISAQLADARAGDVAFFTDVLPELARKSSFTTLLDGARRPGETLVGATIAADGDAASFAARWRRVFDFRDDGAAWGLVALDQHADRDRLSTTLDAALGRADSFTVQALAAAPTTEPKDLDSTPDRASLARDSAATHASAQPKADATASTIPPPNVPAPPPEEPTPPLEQTLDTVGDLVSGLLTTLNGAA